MLPSEVLAKADTLDLHILDLSGRWQRYQREQQEGKVSNHRKVNYSQEQLIDMVNRVKAQER